jgi:hypothetical protein
MPRKIDARDGAHCGCVVKYRDTVTPASIYNARIREHAAWFNTFASA